MDIFNKIENWFDGKKTKIGSILLVLAGSIYTFYTASNWEIQDYMQGILAVITYYGSIFTGVGTAHKMYKTDPKIKSIINNTDGV